MAWIGGDSKGVQMHHTSRNPWWPLILLAHACAGLYFAYETAGALAPDLQSQMGFTSHQIGLLYSAYSIPVFISILCCEYMNKKLGSATCVLLFTFLISLGTLIIAVAPNFPVMFAGQIMFGAGSSPMCLTTTIIMGKWFGEDTVGKRRVSIAFGLVFAWCRFFSFASFIFLPMVSQKVNLKFSMGFSAMVCASSFVAGILFFVADYYKKYTSNNFGEDEVPLSELPEKKNKKPVEQRSLLSMSDEMPESEETQDKKEMSTTTFVVSDEIVNNDTGDVDMEKGVSLNGEESPNQTYKEAIKGLWRTIRGFSLAYWLVVILCILFISDLYTTTAFLTQYLYDEWGFSPESASAVTSFVCLSNVITSPIAGWLAGHTGWRVKCIILGSANLVLIHCLFAFTKAVPAVVLASALGLTQSIMDTNLTPSVVFLVSRKDYSLAMSIASILYNSGLLILPTVCGFLRDLTNSWLSVNVTFIFVSLVSVAVSIWLKCVDWRNGNILDLPFIKQLPKA